jgi:hypothetical protein
MQFLAVVKRHYRRLRLHGVSVTVSLFLISSHAAPTNPSEVSKQEENPQVETPIISLNSNER